MQPVEERFWRYAGKARPTECWLWTGSLSSRGYGSLPRRSGTQYAHRTSWEIHNGPIPNGMFVCHTCDNKRCVNPAHLFLGSHQDNMDDMVRKGRSRAPLGESNGSAKLTEPAVRIIRTSTATTAELAEQFGVSKALIGGVKRRLYWAHVQ